MLHKVCTAPQSNEPIKLCVTSDFLHVTSSWRYCCLVFKQQYSFLWHSYKMNAATKQNNKAVIWQNWEGYIPSLSPNCFKYLSKIYFVAVAKESSPMSYTIMAVDAGRSMEGLLFPGNSFSFEVGYSPANQELSCQAL